MRIPWSSVALQAHDDPKALADPEVAFWLALGRAERKNEGNVRWSI